MQATPKVAVATVPFHSAATLAHVDNRPQRFLFELLALNEGVVGEIEAKEAERAHESQEFSEESLRPRRT
jgi:hypothetical protein